MTSLSPDEQYVHLKQIISRIDDLGHAGKLVWVESEKPHWQINIDDCPVAGWQFDQEWSRGISFFDSKPTGRYRFKLHGFGWGDRGGRSGKSLVPRKDGTYNYKIIAEFLIDCHKYWREINQKQVRQKVNQVLITELRLYPGYPVPGLVCVPSRDLDNMITVQLTQKDLTLKQVQKLVEILRHEEDIDRADDGPGSSDSQS